MRGCIATPQLQANCFRIEVAIHLAMAYCQGHAEPTRGLVCRVFERLGRGYCGSMEDPAESPFAGLVNTPRGNFRIFEGLREGTSFYAQRILNIVGNMPPPPQFIRMRDSIECLLRLSDETARRASVRENDLGKETPLASLPASIAARLSSARSLITFSHEDLKRLDITPSLLAPFTFGSENRSTLCSQFVSHSELERSPIVAVRTKIYLLLSTAVGAAITRFVIETLASMNLAHAFESALAEEYRTLFRDTPILSQGPGVSITLQKLTDGMLGNIVMAVDPGRYLHLIFVVDGTENFLREGFNGVNAYSPAVADVIASAISSASADTRANGDFRDGITLVVACGVGGGYSFALGEHLPDHWRLESMAAHDLVTLSWLANFSPLSVWRILDSEEAINRQGVTLLNPNGFLNLVACATESKGNLVSHADMPDDFVDAGAPAIVWVRQSAVRELRESVTADWDPRRVVDVHGRWTAVRKLGRSSFAEENFTRSYLSEGDAREGRWRGAFLGSQRPWWIEVSGPGETPPELVFEYWKVLCAWLVRFAPIADAAYAGLPPGPMSFHVDFEELVGVTRQAVVPRTAEALRSLIEVSAEIGRSSIRIGIHTGFEDGFNQPDNIAERIIVESLVAGASLAAGEFADTAKRSVLVNKVCPDLEMRWMHRYEARSFREFVRKEINREPCLTDPIDYAACKIGLGWKVRLRESGPSVSGVAECTSYLNDVVTSLLDDLCAELKCLDRYEFVEAVVRNYEAAIHDRDTWKRTSRALLATHDDHDAALLTIVEHHSSLNACFTASRILLEAAICECPLGGGRLSGKLDLSRMFSKVMMVHQLGGWSDAVHWGAMEPLIKITALGDIQMSHEFIDTVYQPFGKVGGATRVKEAADSYAKTYAPAKVLSSVADAFEAKFLEAWTAEFGAPLEGMARFVVKLEEAGMRMSRESFRLLRSEVTDLLAEAAGISRQDATLALGRLTLQPRPEWRVVGDGFAERDWYPWRFGRRLTVLRRPLIEINSEDDPTIICVPGIVNDAFHSMVMWFHKGEITTTQARSREMSQWIGHANRVQRSEFNATVATRMRELNWEVKQEKRLTDILKKSLPMDYGDVDVLAWRRDSRRVLAIECKDVQQQKTIGEIAEQLTDVRGVVNSAGRRDRLKKHLDRLEVLRQHEDAVTKALGLAGPIQIEGHLVFKNAVPMKFAWDHMASRVKLSLYDELDRI